MNQHRYLGETIQTLREKAGLTQDDLSDKAGLAYSTLAKIERGAIKNPSVFTVAGIAQVLGVPMEQLLEGGAQISAPLPKNREVQFFYCDINGVLVRFFQKAFVRIAHTCGQSLDQIETAFWHYNDAANRGEMSITEFDRAMARHLGVPDFDWAKYYLDAVEPILVMHDCLEDISKNYEIGLLSNVHQGLVRGLLERGLIPDLDYATIVDSSEVGAIKPEASMYHIAEEKAGHHGSEILFVDDSRTNLMAAERFGWRVLWFDDYQPEQSVERIKEALASVR